MTNTKIRSIIEDLQIVLNLVEKQQSELEKKDNIIDLMLQEFTDCEFELKCSNCNCECERDYDQLYECNKQYFEKQVEKDFIHKSEDT